MIIPALTLRLAGFLDKEMNFTDIPTELSLAYKDNGKACLIKFTSNKKETTQEDYINFFNNKRDLVIKEKDVNLLASELESTEEFLTELDEELNKEENKNLSRKEQKDFEKKFSFKKAEEIIRNKKTIKRNSVIRTVIDINEEKQEFKEFKGIKLPLYRSRSLIFNEKDEPVARGLYYYAQTNNIVPITISPIFNKEGTPLNLFKLQLSRIATLDHFNFLVSHIQRTIKKQIEKKDKVFVASLNYNYEKLKNHEIINLIKEMTTITKEKDLKDEDGYKYIDLLSRLKDKINENPKLLIDINLGINLMIQGNDFKKMVNEKDNPLKNLSKSFVNLNFSKENPDVKQAYSSEIEKIINDMLVGNIPCEINAIYFIPTESILKESTSWGFMTNNIQRESFILSSEDVLNINNILTK